MAQFFRDFNDLTLDTQPSFLTSRWAGFGALAVKDNTVGDVDYTLTSQANQDVMLPQFLRATSPGPFPYKRCAAEINDITGTTSDEIVVAVNSLEENDSEYIPTVILRGAGAESTRTGYSVWINAGTGNFLIRRADGGAETTLASATLPVYGTGVAHLVRFSCRSDGVGGVDLKVWEWEPGTTEPTTPILDVNDGTPLAVGWFGIGVTSSIGYTSDFGFAGFGTNGDPAPTEAPVTGPTTPINLSASQITATSALLTWSAG